MIELKALQDIGLTQTEAKVYLATLELGNSNVSDISKRSEIKRPTCYLSLDNLFNKGFVTKAGKKSTTLYSVEKPSILLNKFKEKMDNFKDLLPLFEAKFNKGPKPKIRYYEGKEELWNVYTKILFPEREACYFGTDTNKLLKTLPDLLGYWKRNCVGAYKSSKEIVSCSREGFEYAKKENKYREVKIMPKDLPVFADSVITDNKLFIVSLDNLFGVLIESEDLAKTYKNFFLLAWRAANEVK
ncbi:MAG: helix-turn-helix domain-containing protein [Patescibacteria group bacterium]